MKKLINFNEDLKLKIDMYAEKWEVSFTEAVRKLLIAGINVEDANPDFMERVEKIEKDMSWWNADENESKVGNLKVRLDEMEKKINVLTAWWNADENEKKINVLTKVSKLFKAHITDRSIHLQD